MPKTVLIILAAVVALIVIVILTGMRYLRADDEDDFDDDRPAEHGRSPSRGGHPKSSQARARQAHPMELADERRRDRSVAARGTRPAQGRDDRGQDRHGFDQRGTDPRRTDPRLPSRADQDRSWREDSAITSRGGRGGLPVRDPRPARTARRDRDDVSGPLPAARTTRASAARGPGGDDYDSLPGRRASTGEFARQPRDRRNGRDRPAGYEADLGGRGDGRDPREIRDRRPGGDAANSRESRNGRDRTDPRDSRPMASIRNDTDSDIRNRRTSTGPNARPSGRKNGSKPNDELLPAVKPRQSKNKRESNGDWLSDEWDELEDVDYWTELASDGPFSSSSAETPRSARRDRADGGAVPDRAGRADRDGRADRESRPGRDARKDSRIGDDAITKQMSRPPREPDSGLLPAARHRDLPADRPAPGRSADPRPAIADNDPLTSPSFPSVASDDSRSYRRSRSGRSDSRHERGRRSDSSRQAAASDRGSGDRSSYPSMPPVDPVRGFDNASTTRRHSQPAATASDLTAASAGYAAGNGDHYGSQLPGTPAHPASSATSGYQAPAASGTYQTPGASYAGQEGANGSYPLPARYSESGGYQAAASYPPPVSGAYPQANGSSGNSYLPS
ncbi:MAG: hypothetical protein LBV34_09605, partial [Nocardiopsaceae bacterium]|nr:hypothetical protein [Nocardiopsaceae bacterium]